MDKQQLVDDTNTRTTSAVTTTTATGAISDIFPVVTDSIAVQRRRPSSLVIPSMEAPETSNAATDWSLPHSLGATAQQPPPLPLPPYPHPAALVERRRTKPGILRLDMNKPRRSSGGSVEFRAQPQMLGEDITSPTSGTSSPHQLSVTWATPCDTNEPESKFKPLPGQTDAAAAASFLSERGKSLQEDKSYELSSPVDVIESPLQSQLNENDGQHNNNSDAEDDDEDYSISVSAIIQRRASVRGYRNKRGSRNSRRASSPMDQLLDNAERRRSSVYTSSSDEGTNQESTQEQIFENIRLHKEVIQSVKLQPWPMRKKLKLVRQAKTYVARHEGALQERFAMSRSTKDLWARFKILMAARWLHWKRETASFLTVLIPWELRIKEIESHFGSGVASYFTFLRWLMWVNIMIAIPLVAFVIGPEYFATKKDETDPRKRMPEHEFKVAGNLFTFWEFGGYLKYSPMFYGYYSSTSGASSLGYQLPMAYFLTAVVVYIYSFVATLRKMAENSRNSKLSSKDDECTFSWKLFTGWDFMIGHAETAHNRVASVVVGFKEALLEEAEKKKDKRNWRIILQRILINLVVMGLLAASGYTVVALVNKSEDLARQDNWLSRNAVNVTMTLLSFFLPMIFEALGLFENWHPRQQLRLQLARIMILNMLNLYSLMFSFIYNINSKEKPLQELKIKNETATSELLELSALIESFATTTTATLAYDGGASAAIMGASLTDYSSLSTGFDGSGSGSTTAETMLTSTAATVLYSIANRLKCYNITVKCSKPKRVNNRTFATTTMLLINLTTALVPLTTDSSTTWSTQPTTMTTTTTTETTTSPTTEQLTTLILTTSPPSPPSPPSPADIASAPTLTDAQSETTTVEDTTTTPLSTSTTTPSPGNDTFFEYNDYFVGMPIELEASEEAQEELKPQTPSYVKRNPSTSRARPTTNAKQPKALIRRPREADAPQSTASPMRKSKYSRRRNDWDRNDSLEASDATSMTGSAATTTLVTTTTRPSTTSTSTSTAASTTRTTENTTKRQQSESPSVLHSWNDSSLPLWVDKDKLQEVLAYFTSSTTTIDPPPTTKPTTKPTTTEATTEATTPYFIDDDDIEEISDVTYYDVNEFDEDNFEYCVRTVCEEISGDMFTSTTEMDPNASPRTDISVSTLTPLEQHQLRLSQVKMSLSEIEKNLTSMCWETSLGQELSKVIVFDGLMSLLAPLCIDFLRGLFVRYVNQYWCWDMEKTFPEYGDFKIAENILTLINNQGQVWMGIFFSPGLVLVNLVKLVIMMYFRSWIVLTCNVPHEVVFKASKSNNFYLSLLLTMLFLCVLPVGYAIVWLRPSWHCGPFSEFNRISEFITNTTRNALPKELHEPLNYLTSSSTVIPLLLLLILIIYYLVSLTGALREANQDLRTQLQKEREEERKKIFKVPETKPPETTTTSLTSRWRKVLEASSPVTPTQPPDFETEEYKNKARKELISRIMKEALRKGSATSDDDSVVRRDDDDTDTEHHDSLPHDEEAKEKRFGLSKLQQIRRTRKPSLVDIVQIAKNEREREQRASVTPPARGTHAKGSFKHDRKKSVKDKDREKEKETEQKDADKGMESKQSESNENDPEINSRIVNERRQSLLRRKREDEQQAPSEVSIKKNTQEQHTPGSVVDSKRNKYELVDEKKPPAPPADRAAATEPHEQPAHHHHPFGIRGSTFKLRRPRSKAANTAAAEPEVFKFDEKSVEKAHKNGNGNGKHGSPSESHSAQLSSETHPARFSDGLSTPTFIPALYRQANPEKLVRDFSRQGRKKIGSLLALVREAVNTKRNEEEQQQQQHQADSAEPTTPTAGVTPTPAVPPLSDKDATAIDIPSTPKVEVPPMLMPADTAPQTGSGARPNESARPRTVSQRRKPAERTPAMRQDSQASVWSDNIPTITISTTGSEECIVESKAEEKEKEKPAPAPSTVATAAAAPPRALPSAPAPTTSIASAPTTPDPVAKVVKIRIEDDK